HQEWRGVAGTKRPALGLPGLLAALGVEPDQLGLAVLVVVDDHAVLVNHRRSAGAVLAFERAEIAVPQPGALEIVGRHADRLAVPEIAVDALAIGRRRRGAERVLGVRLGFAAGLALVPEDLAVLGAEA